MRFFAALILLLSVQVHAEFRVPALRGPVMDLAGFLTRSDAVELTQLLMDYNQAGKAQIQVLIVPDLQGEPIESASMKIVETWQLGSAKQDNGILFLLAAQERRMRIEVGQGLEGALPDITAKRIISDTVTPLLRAGRMSDGIVVGVHEIIRAVDKEYADGKQLAQAEDRPRESGWKVILFLFVILFLLNRFFRGGPRGGGGDFVTGMILGGMMGSRGGGNSGGGWSGGGGGFSGGGASGSW